MMALASDGSVPSHAMPDLAAMRRNYAAAGLSEADLAPTWLEQFNSWLTAATAAGVAEPNAMVLATADAAGRPSARTVLLKGVAESGFVFFTNRASRKGEEIGVNASVALCFPWIDLERQVTVTGTATPVDDAEADRYFALRPWGSRIGALASAQSEVIPGRGVLETARSELAARYPEGTDVPRPATWGGYRIAPESVEFWQGREDRLHDRLRYRRSADDEWVVERLSP